MRKWMEAWGAYLLSALCLGVIIFSALWTGPRAAAPAPDAQALSDRSQRMADVTPAPTAAPLHRPCQGEILRPFSEGLTYFEETGVWQAHLAVDYAADPGDPVYALKEGAAALSPGCLRLDHGENEWSEYRGLSEILVKEGQSVRAGEKIGRAGGTVPFEGGGIVCVSLYRDGKPVDFIAD